jgi:hypothetical protein
MDVSKKLKKLLEQKRHLLESVEICCKSIEFWEKKANKIFKEMDELEEKSLFEEEDFIQKKYQYLKRECEKLINRVVFENEELDKLELKTIKLEEKIIKVLEAHAKKQKK